MAVLVRLAAPLLALLALATLVSAVMFALADHDLSAVLVVLMTLGLVVDAVLFGVLAWASANPGPTWRPVALVIIALNLVGMVLDQVGLVDILIIIVMVLAALAVLATPRARDRALDHD